MKAHRMLTALILSLNLLGCATTKGTCPRVRTYFPDEPVVFKQRVITPTEVDPGVEPALACCDYYGDCVWVDAFSECPFPLDVFYCEWGISNADGTVDCFD